MEDKLLRLTPYQPVALLAHFNVTPFIHLTLDSMYVSVSIEGPHHV